MSEQKINLQEELQKAYNILEDRKRIRIMTLANAQEANEKYIAALTQVRDIENVINQTRIKQQQELIQELQEKEQLLSKTVQEKTPENIKRENNLTTIEESEEPEL